MKQPLEFHGMLRGFQWEHIKFHWEFMIYGKFHGINGILMDIYDLYDLYNGFLMEIEWE
jgi:hypothetical protein